jgi:prepilin-type processing-associated H-X9-DG protein
MKMNVIFWDGHAELLGDLQSANPKLWMPSGTRILAGRGTEQFPDVYDRYLQGRTGQIVVE